ncbi:hypothetical protein BCV70DRAFT_42895 [Testicularia cyperi]|uniref:Small RNA 2'-O-methyltransferase n=1 Tax=Testicularia cyperi TaxID=1882483 RepID=A0A317XII1_9BASI|nr:hypothetical protein BCV70DRAFT_42895 [Testicularia cyperi]
MVAKLYFDPPLWLQRQSWVLSKLRQEHADSVVDVGCSNGVLLSALMQPAFQLDQFPVHRFPALAVTDSATAAATSENPVTKHAVDDDHSNLLSTRHWIYSPNDIVPSRIAGLDVERKALENAKSSLSAHGIALTNNRPRWKSLDVRLFHGLVETENETLEDYDAFVATEVIEHLEDEALQRFAPTVFGKYRPRVVLITTPNYCFNEHFGDDLSTRPGFPDPTGRTSRVFRHEDHKFEFTPEEFQAWCASIADDYGYEVKVQGLGAGIYRVAKRDMVPPPSADQTGSAWKASRPRTTGNTEERLRFASQAAFFVRHSAAASSTAERHHSTDLDSSHPFSDRHVQRSVPKPPVDSRVHDIFDEAVRRVGGGSKHNGGAGNDADDDEDGGRSGRQARSRRPENLPFLSSPSPLVPATPSGGSEEASNLLGITMSASSPLNAAVMLDSKAPATPFTGHSLIWSHRYPCSLEKRQTSCTGKRQIQTAVPLPADEIVAKVVEKQRQLYVEAQWDGDEAGPGQAAPGKEAVSSLQKVWFDDEIRAACGGRVNALLDALRLVAVDSASAPTPAADASASIPSGLAAAAAACGGAPLSKSITVGSDGTHWDLRVQTTHHSNASSPDKEFVDSDLYLVYKHTAVAKWQASIDEARNWVPRRQALRWNSSHAPNSASVQAEAPVGNGGPLTSATARVRGRSTDVNPSLFAIQAPTNASSLNPTWE